VVVCTNAAHSAAAIVSALLALTSRRTARSGDADASRLALPTHTAAAIVAACLPFAGRKRAGTSLAFLAASLACAVHRTGIAILVRVTGGIPAPGNVHTQAVSAALVVLQAGTTDIATAVVAAFPTLTGGEHANPVSALFATKRAAAVRSAGVAVFVRITGAVSTPGDVDALAVSTALVVLITRPAVLTTTIGATLLSVAIRETAGSVHTNAAHCTLAAASFAAVVAALPSFAGDEQTLTCPTFFSTTHTAAVGVTRLTILTRIARAVAAPRDVLAQPGLPAFVVLFALTAGTSAAVGTTLFAHTGSELAFADLALLATQRAAAILGAGLTVLVGIAMGVPAPRDIDAQPLLAALEVFLTRATGPSASVVAAFPARTIHKLTLTLHALLSTSDTAAVCGAHLAILTGIARCVSAPWHVHALSVPVALEVLVARPALAATAIVPTDLADTGGEHAGASLAGLAALGTGTVRRTQRTVLAEVGFAYVVAAAFAAIHRARQTSLLRITDCVATFGAVLARPLQAYVELRTDSARSPTPIRTTLLSVAGSKGTHALDTLFTAQGTSAVHGTGRTGFQQQVAEAVAAALAAVQRAGVAGLLCPTHGVPAPRVRHAGSLFANEERLAIAAVGSTQI